MKNNSKLGVSVGVALTLVSLLMFSPLTVSANNPGLRVFVYVHNAPIDSTAFITATVGDDFNKYKEVQVPTRTFYVEFNMGSVQVGDKVYACAHIQDENLEGCSSTVNGEANEPERIDIYLKSIGGGGGSEDSGSSSSSASSSSSSASSSSSSSSSNLCLAFCNGDGGEDTN